jgi:dsRNA-specific ribonuclease
MFTAEVIVGQDTWGMGIGASKQAAEQAAAQQALQKHPSL